MAISRKLDAVVSIGTYQDRDGNEKRRYKNVGTLMEHEDGRFSLKLEMLPVGNPEWDGWINFYPPRANDAGDKRRAHAPAWGAEEPPAEAAGARSAFGDDDIPF